eukprot:Opistho-1_new@11367
MDVGASSAIESQEVRAQSRRSIEVSAAVAVTVAGLLLRACVVPYLPSLSALLRCASAPLGNLGVHIVRRRPRVRAPLPVNVIGFVCVAHNRLLGLIDVRHSRVVGGEHQARRVLHTHGDRKVLAHVVAAAQELLDGVLGAPTAQHRSRHAPLVALAVQQAESARDVPHSDVRKGRRLGLQRVHEHKHVEAQAAAELALPQALVPEARRRVRLDKVHAQPRVHHEVQADEVEGPAPPPQPRPRALKQHAGDALHVRHERVLHPTRGRRAARPFDVRAELVHRPHVRGALVPGDVRLYVRVGEVRRAVG